ncbi:DNA phosphorothioation system sulfurtransferase DndC [Riemerella anatipestifer]|uniref:DNA phosphorothioation system sulfurtransferase DndC n=1 Tax=Riemerella anatipestifer TaxID=34085 RepID=UPI00129E9353|nr:DNA phosphorothioation system sulfurtransferase DndC [Riemerella anatipestifer]MRN04759.1 DNA phosphorothioation system sulfurtransferase DndC [Riemerella anatipestifer]
MHNGLDQYIFADDTKRPWIIGFSGGKDSTVMLQLVWEALKQIKDLHSVVSRDIYVVCNDTMVENPVITEYVHRVLDKIEQAAVEQDIPIRVVKTIPRLEDSFWVNLIGKGYPAPNNAFRWCTERLKIKPTSRFILEQVSEFGEAIILIGTRSAESANRAKSMKKHAIKGKRLTKHPTQPNTFMYAPIRHLMLEEVWYIINTMPSPWGADNNELFQIYLDASADDYECPTVVTDKQHKSCGQSRFGCWTCTVVKQDKSMSALIENGLTWLTPLLKLRNELAIERNIIENRMPQRRNGTDAVNGMGPYFPWYRASVLYRLLKTQREVQKHKPHIELITNQELIAIQTIWYRDFVFDQKVSEIYHKAYKTDLDMKDQNEKKEKELELLRKTCEKNPRDFELIQELLTLQKNKSLLNRKRGLKEDIETRIEEYLKKEK